MGRTMRTRDGGQTWEGVYSKRLDDGSYTSTGLDVTTNYGVHFDPFDSKRMFISYTDIGLFRSENGGRGWVSATETVPRRWTNTTYWMVFDPKVRGRVWAVVSGVHDLPRPKMWRRTSPASFSGGVVISEDGGRTWRVSNNGMPETAATHILLDAASPENARVLYVAGFGRGVFKSTDGGKSWTLQNDGLPPKEPFAWRLAQGPDRALYLVVARRSEDGSFGNDSDGALYRSTDAAAHWSRIALPTGVNGPNGIAIDPRDPARLYLAAWGRMGPESATSGGIWISADAGRTWRNTLSRDQFLYDVTIDPRDPHILYACGFSSSAWRSADRGETWKRIRGFNFKWGHRVIPDPLDSGQDLHHDLWRQRLARPGRGRSARRRRHRHARSGLQPVILFGQLDTLVTDLERFDGHVIPFGVQVGPFPLARPGLANVPAQHGLACSVQQRDGHGGPHDFAAQPLLHPVPQAQVRRKATFQRDVIEFPESGNLAHGDIFVTRAVFNRLDLGIQPGYLREAPLRHPIDFHQKVESTERVVAIGTSHAHLTL